MTKRILIGVGAASAMLLLYLVAGGAPPSESELASKFYRDNVEDLRTLTLIVKPLPRATRIDRNGVEIPRGCSSSPPCRSASLEAQAILRKTRAYVLAINEDCSGDDRCSFSIVFRRKGIAVSGSGTELIYDTAPDWGHFKIHPVPSAPKHWYYRHLGD